MLSTVVLCEPGKSLATVELMVTDVGSVSLVCHLHGTTHQVAILGATLAGCRAVDLPNGTRQVGRAS